MQRKYTLFALLSVCLLGAVVGYFTIYHRPITSKAVSIAVINNEMVREKALPYVKLMEMRLKEMEKLHDESIREEKKLREEYQSLKKGQPTSIQKIEFDKKLADFEQSFQKKREKATEKLNEALEEVETIIYDIVGKITKEYGFNLVLNTTSYGRKIVMYNDECFDITEKVIEHANSRMEELKVLSQVQ